MELEQLRVHSFLCLLHERYWMILVKRLVHLYSFHYLVEYVEKEEVESVRMVSCLQVIERFSLRIPLWDLTNWRS